METDMDICRYGRGHWHGPWHGPEHKAGLKHGHEKGQGEHWTMAWTRAWTQTWTLISDFSIKKTTILSLRITLIKQNSRAHHYVDPSLSLKGTGERTIQENFNSAVTADNTVHLFTALHQRSFARAFHAISTNYGKSSHIIETQP